MFRTDMIPSEFVRGLRRMFTITDPVHVATEVLPVIVMDDWSRGPYPGSKLWHGFHQKAALIANFSFVAVRNLGAKNSVIVVDRCWYRVNGLRGDVLVALWQGINPGIASPIAAVSRNLDLDASSSLPIEISVPEVELSASTTGVGIGATKYLGGGPAGDAGPSFLEGPFILGAGHMMTVMGVSSNVPFEASFQGRYYPVIG